VSAARTLGVVVVGILLTATLAGANASVAAERTALDQQYVIETFEDEGVSERIGSDLRGDIATQIDQAGQQRPIPAGVTVTLDGGAVANRSVTDEFVAGEVSRNVGVVISYLRGNRETLTLTTNVAAVKTEVRAAIIDGTDIDTPELIAANTDRISAERVAALNESEQSYREAQVDLSDQERTEVQSEIEQSADQQLGNDSQELSAAVSKLPGTVLDGLTGEVSYEEYTDQLAADERAIKIAIADFALEELPDEQSLVNGTSSAESDLEPIRSGVGLVVLFSWLGPLLAVVLVGGLYAISRSLDTTAMATGVALAVAGVLGAGVAYIVGPRVVRSTEPSAEADPIVAGLTAVVNGTLATIGRQSAVLLVAGILLVGVVLADRRGLLDRVRSRLGQEPRAS
jgi:hypothetical protein